VKHNVSVSSTYHELSAISEKPMIAICL